MLSSFAAHFHRKKARKSVCPENTQKHTFKFIEVAKHYSPVL